MTTRPSRAGAGRAIRLNLREVYPVRSLRHPVVLSTPPSDALAVIWLDSEGPRSDPRFAYLNYSRALHLYTELGRILNGEDRASTERARRALMRPDPFGDVSGA